MGVLFFLVAPPVVFEALLSIRDQGALGAAWWVIFLPLVLWLVSVSAPAPARCERVACLTARLYHRCCFALESLPRAPSSGCSRGGTTRTCRTRTWTLAAKRARHSSQISRAQS